MPIKIIRSIEPIHIDFIAVCLYSMPGIGKTTVGQTAEDPLTLDFDKGIHRAKNRKDSIICTSWADIEDLQRDDLDPYKTIVVDTVGRAIDALCVDIIAANPKRGAGGALDLKGWGIAKQRFTAWLNMLKSWGLDIVLIAHMDEKQEGDILKERLDVQGGSKAEIYKTVDAMGKLYIDGKNRMLDFSPREGSLGKNPGQLDILTVKDPTLDPTFLATTIAKIKGVINQRGEELTAAATELDGWKAKFEALKNCDAFNTMLLEVLGNKPEVRATLNVVAEAKGLKFNSKQKRFEEA